jgi:hypothetical protein
VCARAYDPLADTCEVDGSLLGEPTVKGDLLAGPTIKRRYRVVRKLGDGPRGAVYLAERVATGRKVAIKVLRVELAGQDEAVKQFWRTAQLAATSTSPYVVSVYERDRTDEGHLFVAMEYLDGMDLAAVLRRGPLEPVRAVRIALQVAQGLDAAGRMGVLHHDLKPQNVILVGPTERATLTDFGVAQLRSMTTGGGPGDPDGATAYVAPEALAGAEPGVAADVYAVGAMLCEMLTGAAPGVPAAPGGAAPGPGDASGPPGMRHPSIPADLERLVVRAIDADPERRPASMAELAEGLRTVRVSLGTRLDLAARPAATPAPTITWYPPLPPPRDSVAERPAEAPDLEADDDERWSRAGGRALLLGGVAAVAVAAGLVWTLPNWRLAVNAKGSMPPEAALALREPTTIAPDEVQRESREAEARQRAESERRAREAEAERLRARADADAARQRAEQIERDRRRQEADVQRRAEAERQRQADSARRAEAARADEAARQAEEARRREAEAEAIRQAEEARRRQAEAEAARQAEAAEIARQAEAARARADAQRQIAGEVEPSAAARAPALSSRDLARLQGQLEQKLRGRGLLRESSADRWGVSVDVGPTGSVKLSGQLRDQGLRDEAVRLAREVSGVPDVTTQVRVADSGAAAASQSEAADVRARIERRLRARGLLRESGSDRWGVTVEIGPEGDVLLAGALRDVAMQQEAVRLAQEAGAGRPVRQQISIVDRAP